MTNYLADFLISSDELTGMEDALKEQIKVKVQATDRLRTYMQLLFIARVSIDALENLNTTGFIEQLKSDIALVNERANKELKNDASNIKLELETIEQMVTNLEKELNARSCCIEDVLEGLASAGSTDEVKTLRIEIHNKLGELEQIVKHIVDIRKTQAFAEVCNM